MFICQGLKRWFYFNIITYFFQFASKSLTLLSLMTFTPTFTVHCMCNIKSLTTGTFTGEYFDEMVLKRSVKAFLNSSFDKLNPCLARAIALSQLDAPIISVFLITCLVDMGRASSICSLIVLAGPVLSLILLHLLELVVHFYLGKCYFVQSWLLWSSGLFKNFILSWCSY